MPSTNVQRRLVTSLVDVALAANQAQLVSTCMTSLKQLQLEVDHVSHELQPPPAADENKSPVKAVKKAK